MQDSLTVCTGWATLNFTFQNGQLLFRREEDFMDHTTTALVTGATGIIGRAIAHSLVGMGIRTVLIGRDPKKTSRITAEINKDSGNDLASFKLADLSRRRSIIELANSWEDPIQILINNAAAAPATRKETPEGIEVQFATNVLGYYWMMESFKDQLTASGCSRIINVASYWAGGLDLNDLEFERRPYDNNAAYRQSKQADRMISRAFSDLLKEHNITVNSCHPGDVHSTLSRNLGFGGHQTPSEAADTPAWLAVSKQVDGVTGKYFEKRTAVPCPFSSQRDQVESLYQRCGAYR